MQYKCYKLDAWCKKAKIRMIEKDISINDIISNTGYTRAHATSVLNGRLRSQTARDKISDFLGISNYYSE